MSLKDSAKYSVFRLNFMSNMLLLETLTLVFNKPANSYDVCFGQNLLNDSVIPTFCKSISESAVIITDNVVGGIYGQALQANLQRHGLTSHLLTFPAGEQYKTRQTKETLEDQLIALQLGRNTTIIALGGGVVTDVAGFLAATYCRGVPLILIPTSLLAMVDATIGGKNGVNTPKGKNLVGTIYQPKAVFVDTDTLRTLPFNEYQNGIVEMLKHGLICDADYVDYLERYAEQILSQHPAIIQKAIFESCRIKKAIVEEDEEEKGKRRLLNFGHTVGHALEAMTNYRMPHGQAVAIGMLTESRLATTMGFAPMTVFERITHLLKLYKIKIDLPEIDSRFFSALLFDKKMKNGEPRVVMLSSIGKAVSFDGEYCIPVNQELICRVLSELNIM